MTCSKNITVSEYINLRAYPGYGDGVEQMYYNASSTLIRTNSATDISLKGNTVLHAGNYTSYAATSGHTHDGRYIRWSNSTADTGAMSWGTLTSANGYNILAHCSSSDGGDMGWCYKGGQISYQVDGFFYQNEGRYKCIDEGNISSQSVNYANSAGSATSSAYFPTCYIGGDQPNPQTYFSSSIGCRVAMTRYADIGMGTSWHDTLWVNGYSGGDVPYMCALHFKRNGEPRFSISSQTDYSTGYGSMYEVITKYNIGSQSVNYATSAGSATNNIPKLAWQSYDNGASINDLVCGTTFYYTTHGCPTSGCVLAFSGTHNSYQTQIQADYGSGVNFYFRTKNGDNGTWNAWRRLLRADEPASSVSWSNVTGKPFNWSGQSGQPTWLWGSNDGTNYYVWNPSNFSVNYANSAGSAGSASVASGLYYNSDGTLKIWSQSGGGCHGCGTETMCIQSLFDGCDPYTDPYGYIPVYTNRCVIALQPKGGYVGINNTAPSYPLHISGNVGGTNFYATSDRHLKKCISNISTSSLEHLFSISDKLLKKFTWKGNNKKTYGFIAQEIEKYIPEAVDINNNGKFVSYNIAYAKIIASLINEIKKLKKDNQMIMKLIQSS